MDGLVLAALELIRNQQILINDPDDTFNITHGSKVWTLHGLCVCVCVCVCVCMCVCTCVSVYLDTVFNITDIYLDTLVNFSYETVTYLEILRSI